MTATLPHWLARVWCTDCHHHFAVPTEDVRQPYVCTSCAIPHEMRLEDARAAVAARGKAVPCPRCQTPVLWDGPDNPWRNEDDSRHACYLERAARAMEE